MHLLYPLRAPESTHEAAPLQILEPPRRPAPSFHHSRHPLCVVVIPFSSLCLTDYPEQSGLPPPPSSAPQFSAPGLDFESAVLMRMRQAERERLEREIREQEASEA
jgi:hypothetical protein